MEKTIMGNRYFSEFDETVTPHLDNLGIPAYIFYGTVFHPNYEHVLNDVTESSVGTLFSNGVEIAQWRGGKGLPKRIYNLVLADPGIVLDRYEEDLEILFSERNLSEEQLADLGTALRSYINEIEQYCVIPNPFKETTVHLCAYALVNTIFCDGIVVKGINGLSIDMKRIITNVQNECRKNNVAFTDARMLYSLCTSNSLLLNVLNKVGIGEMWREKLDAYIERPRHREYSNPVEYNEWLFFAMIIAARNGRKKANEADLVCAIMRTSKSSTLNKLMTDLKNHDIDQLKWDELVLKTDKERSQSSF